MMPINSLNNNVAAVLIPATKKLLCRNRPRPVQQGSIILVGVIALGALR